MMPNTYRTMIGQSTSFLREKGSKFYGFAHHVASETDVKEVLAGYRKQYFDATHHCYAYVLGEMGQNVRANDDGEPNHSAGDPILGQIRSHRLTNVLVVVVRYYGGTKLGVGGLIAAYKSAAQLALDAAVVEERKITSAVTITFTYQATNEVMRQINLLDISIDQQQFDMACVVTGQIPVGNKELLLKNLEMMENVRVEFP